jgi:hypothetical protein
MMLLDNDVWKANHNHKHSTYKGHLLLLKSREREKQENTGVDYDMGAFDCSFDKISNTWQAIHVVQISTSLY